MLFWSFFSLDDIIKALIATRILEQFVAQVFARDAAAESAAGPPAAVADVALPAAVRGRTGRLAVRLRSTGLLFIAMGAITLVAGFIVFLIWAKRVALLAVCNQRLTARCT